MKITPRFALVFILYAAALLIGVGWLAYTSGRNSLRSATISELESTALRKEDALTRWVGQKQLGITVLSNDPTVIDVAGTLMTSPPNSQQSQNAHDALLANLQPHLTSGEFVQVSLLDPESGQVIASTDPGEEGKFKEDRLYFRNGKTGPYVQNPYYSIALQKIAMTASAPVHGSDGQLIAVIAAHLNLKDVNDLMSRRIGHYNTDDAYLVNTSSLFVTQPRFIENPAVLQRGVHSADIDACLQQKSGVVETPDYRNVLAFIVYRWVPDRQLCLVVKVDQAEAYAPVRAFGSTILLISAIGLLVAAGLAVALARSLTRPILALQAGAARFGRGELEVRLAEGSSDELGQLAGELNKMAEALSEQQTHLRRRAEQFFNLTPDLLCTIDPNGNLLDLNPAWEPTLGYGRDELRGRPLRTFIHEEDASAAMTALQRVVAGAATAHFEVRGCHKDGSYRWLAWSIVTSQQERLLYAAARDVTERRLSEEKLRQQTEELERSNRELEQFAYVASHDLQEPLRLISSYVQLLARRYQGRLDQDADEFIGYAVEGANRMKSLITDLLAYSRVGTRGNELATVDMEQALQRATDHLKLAVQENTAIITHDPLPPILGDAVQMVQLFQNLIGNAIKFRSSQAPQIHVGVKELGEHWLFFVHDNGIGIDPQYTERVFVIFQRLHNRDEYPGTGIGLAICRKIVERHGGRIWVDSEPGKGATFYFTLLPADRPSAPGPRPEPVKPPAKDAIADRATDLI